jgi:oligoribonuclease NrnB/cAMP/cGMP phosphodiesterase (DHH superfamily)
MQVDSDNLICLYHGNCNDGFCAAWVMRQLFGDLPKFMPATHGHRPPNVKGKTVFLLDFSYKRPVMEKLIESAERVIVLDHHKTAKADLDGLADKYPEKFWYQFDMDKSGGRLAWEFCTVDKDQKAPWLVDYTEDRDLWRKALPNTEEINAAITSYPHDFEVWDLLDKLPSLDDLVQEGKGIVRYRRRQVERAIDNAIPMTLAGHEILAVNATSEFSEIAGELAKGKPFGAAWFIRGDGKKQWSLRSDKNGVDVAEIAAKFGGGGHVRAAGFEEVV